jgi:hypothetical protein
VLPGTRDVHSQVKNMVLILLSFFFDDFVDIFRSMQFIMWQAIKLFLSDKVNRDQHWELLARKFRVHRS